MEDEELVEFLDEIGKLFDGKTIDVIEKTLMAFMGMMVETMFEDTPDKFARLQYLKRIEKNFQNHVIKRVRKKYRFKEETIV